jgi:septal ring factor EnvC (AmiA/AmiB activator)
MPEHHFGLTLFSLLLLLCFAVIIE